MKLTDNTQKSNTSNNSLSKGMPNPKSHQTVNFDFTKHRTKHAADEDQRLKNDKPTIKRNG